MVLEDMYQLRDVCVDGPKTILAMMNSARNDGNGSNSTTQQLIELTDVTFNVSTSAATESADRRQYSFSKQQRQAPCRVQATIGAPGVSAGHQECLQHRKHCMLRLTGTEV